MSKNSVAIKNKGQIKLKIDIFPFETERTAKILEITIPRYITPSI